MQYMQIGGIKMNQTQEQQMLRKLENIWLEIYRIKKDLGENHELYDTFEILSYNVNHVENMFRTYLRKKESAAIGVTANS